MTQEAQVQETLDFRIDRLGAPRYPSPMRSVQAAIEAANTKAASAEAAMDADEPADAP